MTKNTSAPNLFRLAEHASNPPDISTAPFLSEFSKALNPCRQRATTCLRVAHAGKHSGDWLLENMPAKKPPSLWNQCSFHRPNPQPGRININPSANIGRVNSFDSFVKIYQRGMVHKPLSPSCNTHKSTPFRIQCSV